MKLWMSAERMGGDVGDDENWISNFAEAIINKELESINFQIDGVDEWFVVTILLPTGDPVFDQFNERQRFDRKGKTLEYRLRIDYQAFCDSDFLGRVDLFFGMLLRSADLMKAKKIPQAKIDILKEVCLKAAERIKTKISKL